MKFINVEEMLKKEIKKQSGGNGYISFPKKYVGKKVIILIGKNLKEGYEDFEFDTCPFCGAGDDMLIKEEDQEKCLECGEYTGRIR